MNNNNSGIGTLEIDGLKIGHDEIVPLSLPKEEELEHLTDQGQTAEGFDIAMPMVCSRIGTGELVVLS